MSRFSFKDGRRLQPRINAQKLNVTLIFLVLAALPFSLYLPIWPVLLVLAASAWRWWLRRRGGRIPHAVLRYMLTLVMALVVYVTFGNFNGIEPGSALLLVMAAMKLLESVTVRDLLVLIYMSFFMILAHFLFDQSLPSTLLGVSLVWVGLGTLIQVNRDTAPEPVWQLGRKSGRLMLHALPIMLLLFVLFPRIPGPFWALPSSDTGKTGLSGTMSPGDISRLLESSEIAFRVYFKAERPSRSQLYWRGPVLESLQENTWSQRTLQTAPSRVELAGTAIDYTLVLEPHQAHWLLGLEFAHVESLPRSASFRTTGELVWRKVISERLRVDLTSYPNYRFAVELDDSQRTMNLDTTKTDNPQTQQLARQWKRELAEPRRVVNQALRHFNQEPFVYSLTDTSLNKKYSVDDFLFNRRRGFCEHYASSFALLMRYAGIPARVVTGYMGGEFNALSGHMTVRQSDAHAWAEVWLENEGWVRIDPTGAVAPERVEQGIANALPDGEFLPGLMMSSSNLITGLRQTIDAINAHWNNWVLGYSDERQWSLLNKLGFKSQSLTSLIALLTASLTVALLLLALWLKYRNVYRPSDPVVRLYYQFSRRLTRMGIAFDPTEDALAYGKRAARQAPEYADAVTTFCEAYQRARYGRTPSPETIHRLRAELARLPGLRLPFSRRTV